MEKIYSEGKNACKLTKVAPDKIRFLMDYSRSLSIVGYNRFKFESNLN